MKRTTLLTPLLMAFVGGMLVGGRLLPAAAEQPGPVRVAPGDCDDALRQRDQALLRAKRLAVRSRAAAAAVEQLRGRVGELEQLLAREQARSKKMEDQLHEGIIDRFPVE